MHKESRKPDSSANNLKLYDVFKGEVVSVQSYGAFVKIPECPNQGLVHISQMSHMRVEEASDVVTTGETIYCKVINIDKEGDKTKIGLSMKLVNQTTGQDTDPNNVELTMEQNKKKSGFQRRDFQKIELGAFLDTTCRKCGGKGHLTQDCFQSVDGKKYDLIPEIDFDSVVPAAQIKTTPSKPHHKHNKQKKSKKDRKEHKHKTRKRTKEADCSTSSSPETKKHKSRHKHSRRRESETSTRTVDKN